MNSVIQVLQSSDLELISSFELVQNDDNDIFYYDWK